MPIKFVDLPRNLKAFDYEELYPIDVNAKELRECATCHNVSALKSYRTECGHVMCGLCLNIDLMLKGSLSRRCGSCSQWVTRPTKINYDRALELGVFKCECGIVGTLVELATHRPQCHAVKRADDTKSTLHDSTYSAIPKQYPDKTPSSIPSYRSLSNHLAMADYPDNGNKPYNARSRYPFKDDYVGSRDWFNNAYGTRSPYSFMDYYPKTMTDAYRPYGSAKSAYPSTTYGDDRYSLWDPMRSSAYGSTRPVFPDRKDFDKSTNSMAAFMNNVTSSLQTINAKLTEIKRESNDFRYSLEDVRAQLGYMSEDIADIMYETDEVLDEPYLANPYGFFNDGGSDKVVFTSTEATSRRSTPARSDIKTKATSGTAPSTQKKTPSETGPSPPAHHGATAWAEQQADGSWLYKFDVGKLERTYAKKTPLTNAISESVGLRPESNEISVAIEIMGKPTTHALLCFVVNSTRDMKNKKVVVTVHDGNGSDFITRLVTPFDSPAGYRGLVIIDFLQNVVTQDFYRKANGVLTISVVVEDVKV